MTPRASSLALLALSVLLLLSVVQGAFQYAPVLRSFAKAEGTASYYAAQSLCGDSGAYLATEATAALHESHAKLGAEQAGGAMWYAFLGGDATTPEGFATLCPPSFLSTTRGVVYYDRYNCVYRWNTGRWREFDDTSARLSAAYIIYRGGISFYRGTQFQRVTDATGEAGCDPAYCYPTNDFHSYFAAPTAGNVALSNREARPGANGGHYVILVGTGATTVWSDNEAAGGYVYEGFTPATNGPPAFGDYSATVSSFIAVCDAQAPSRVLLEPYVDPASSSNLNWWVIFLVILIVVCLIAFVIIACCQERENTEEPPEDAPQWAQREANDVKHTKRYVSQKNFGQSKYEDENTQGSFRSAGSARRNDEDGGNRGIGHN